MLVDVAGACSICDLLRATKLRSQMGRDQGRLILHLLDNTLTPLVSLATHPNISAAPASHYHRGHDNIHACMPPTAAPLHHVPSTSSLHQRILHNTLAPPPNFTVSTFPYTDMQPSPRRVLLQLYTTLTAHPLNSPSNRIIQKQHSDQRAHGGTL